MITSLFVSFVRVVLAWYVIGLLILFLGDPSWAQSSYLALARYPLVPQFLAGGLSTAAKVQITLLGYWTLPLLVLVVLQLIFSRAWMSWHIHAMKQDEKMRLTASGSFSGVSVASYSIGTLPLPTVPFAHSDPIVFVNEELSLRKPAGQKRAIEIQVSPDVAQLLKGCPDAEVQVCAELVQLMGEHPGHYAGAGHGVDLLEHTFNVAEEALTRCTSDFRLPFIAAFAHDIGKLLTFRKDEAGGWTRVGLHSREGARILSALPSFPSLPLIDQRALILALKHGHNSHNIPVLGGDEAATVLAQRILYSLSAADKSATAAEKDRNLEKLQPQDLLWQDFTQNLRNAPVVQRGKKGGSNQLNIPLGSPYVYIYEAPWRESAVTRLPEEIAAVLDLHRRDNGKIAKYTKILLERLEQEGLLVKEHEGMKTPEDNPLWNISSGMPGKDQDTATRMNGVIVVHAKRLWEAINAKHPHSSDFIVQILCPNADGLGNMAGPREDARNIPQLADKMSLQLSPDVANKTSAKPVNDLAVMDRIDDKKASEIGLLPKDSLAELHQTKRASRRYKDESDIAVPGTYAAPKEIVASTPGQAQKPMAGALPAAMPEAAIAKPAPVAANAPAPILPPAPARATQDHPAQEVLDTPSEPPALTPEDYLILAMRLASGEPIDTPVVIAGAAEHKKTPATEAPPPVLMATANLEEDETPPVTASESAGDFADAGIAAASLGLEDDHTLANWPAQEVFEQEQRTATEAASVAPLAHQVDYNLPTSPPMPVSTPLATKVAPTPPPAVQATPFNSEKAQEPPQKEGLLNASEQAAGIGIASREIAARFTHLKVGSKYYTAKASLVLRGVKKEGQPYNSGQAGGPARENQGAPLIAPKPLIIGDAGIKKRRKFD